MKRIVLCPQCKKETEFSAENPFRPFCSERCRLIDLGDWASENFRVPAEPGENMQLDEFAYDEMSSDIDAQKPSTKKN